MRSLIIGLVALAMSFTAVASEPVKTNPGYFTSIAVTSSAYESDLTIETELNDASVVSVENRLAGVIPLEGCGQLMSTVDVSIAPRSNREEADVRIKIVNQPLNDHSCEGVAVQTYTPIDINVPIQVGTSNLNLKLKDKNISFDVKVLFVPEELAEQPEAT